MSETLPASRDGARSRVRSAVTTVLLIMISVMIVRDIFVRRWGAGHARGNRRGPPVPINREGLRLSGKSP